MKLRFWVLLIGMTFSTTIGNSQALNIDEEILWLMEKYEAVGISVAAVKKDKIIYAKSFGMKNREDSVALQLNHYFRIASISKTFVATAIMQLVENGKISLDDDVNQYLDFKVRNPLFPDKPITIEMLLSHRSSINDSQGSKNFDYINPQTNLQFGKCYNEYEPGKRFCYCNLNYGLLGAIIEKRTKTRFDKYVNKNILKPLKIGGSFNCLVLDSTLFASSYKYNRKKDSLVLSYETYANHKSVLDKYKIGYSTPALSPAGGLKITILDLAQYMIMHMYDGTYNKKHIITQESESRMRQLIVKRIPYALSLSHYKNIIPEQELIGQTGGAYGIHTAMIFHPKEKYGFVVFCNGCKSKSTDGHELNFEIIKVLYKIIDN